MSLHDAFYRIVQQERFERLCAAFEAACRWELYNSQTLFGNKLYAMGAWIDDRGDWRMDTRPTQPQSPARAEPGVSHDAEVEL